MPYEYSALTSLTHLNLANNRLSGLLKLGKLTNLVDLRIQNNYFSGELTELSNLLKLSYLDIRNNRFSKTNFSSLNISNIEHFLH